ncbi:hypothetical protein NQ318_000031 [Aromia moschata]|uniref:Integrase p58-like C-terminal domain-containing protein n=1 Tax=Aromia moschata TaxID=1265417 RepID=A0AAV8YD88_9CUCU|nr:hypothetical protein NQ318_000031 [Aromia moschata]
MNETEVICRFCLKTIKKPLPIDKMTEEIIETLMLRLDLRITSEPVMCYGCVETLQTASDFESACIYTKNCLYPFIEGKSEAGRGDSDRCTPIEVIEEKVEIKKLLENYFPEVVMQVIEKPVACENCYNFLHQYSLFVTSISNVEQQIQSYAKKMLGRDYVAEVDLRQVREFSLSNVTKRKVETIGNEKVTKEEVMIFSEMESKEKIIPEEKIKCEEIGNSESKIFMASPEIGRREQEEFDGFAGNNELFMLIQTPVVEEAQGDVDMKRPFLKQIETEVKGKYLEEDAVHVEEMKGESEESQSIVMGRELRLPCDLKFGCTPGDDVAGEDYVSTLRQRMDDIHERVRSNIQGASDRMKETYDINANDGRYQPGNQVWLYNPQRRRGLSPKLQSSWEGPYEVVTRINDVVYRIQKLPRGKPRVVHFNRLAPFAGNNDEQAEARVRHVSPPDGELSFEEFMLLHSNGQKARYGVTREEPRDLFQAPADFCLAHCVAADLRMSRGIALTFKKAFGQLEELRRQRPEVGRVLQITAAEQEKERSVFYLVTKQLSHHKPTYQTVWDTLVELRDVLLSQSISSLAIPKIASGLDGLDWRVIRSMLEVLFRFTGIEILVCCYNPRRSLNEKTVDCFFYQTSRCKNGNENDTLILIDPGVIYSEDAEMKPTVVDMSCNPEENHMAIENGPDPFLKYDFKWENMVEREGPKLYIAISVLKKRVFKITSKFSKI